MGEGVSGEKEQITMAEQRTNEEQGKIGLLSLGCWKAEMSNSPDQKNQQIYIFCNF